MSKEKEVKTTVVSFELTQEEDYKHPSKWYIVDALGNAVYFHSRDRAIVQQECDKIYGKGKYKIRAASDSKGGGTQSAVGRINSKSRSGTYTKNLMQSQGR